MKKRWMLVLSTLLLSLLTACGTQDADIEAAVLEHGERIRVGLQVGSVEAAVSGVLDGTIRYGEIVTLRAAPFRQGDVIYFPLEDVLPLMGGSCQVDGDTARVQFKDQNMIFRVGSPDIIIDGVVYHGINGEERMPQVVNGVFFLPHGMKVPGAGTGLDGPLNWVYLEEGRMVLSDSDAFKDELCAAGAWMEEPFEDIPASVRRTLKSVGTEHPETARYNTERYNGDGISIWVSRPDEGEEESTFATGFVVCIQLTGDRYQTWRGLRVGDSRERAELLYGYLGPDTPEISAPFTAFPLEVAFDETDHVSKITFNSYMFHAQ